MYWDNNDGQSVPLAVAQDGICRVFFIILGGLKLDSAKSIEITVLLFGAILIKLNRNRFCHLKKCRIMFGIFLFGKRSSQMLSLVEMIEGI